MVCEKSGEPTWRELATAYVERLARRGASRSTIVLETRALRGFVHFLESRRCPGVRELTTAKLVGFAWWLRALRVGHGHRRGERWLQASVLTWTNVVRRFLRHVAREGHTLVDWSLWLEPVKVPRTLPRVLTQDEVKRLLAAPSGDAPREVRDRAVLELFYASGLRVGELVGLDLSDLDLLAGEVLVRRGKGGRDRRVPVGAAAIAALGTYLREAREALTASGTGGSVAAVFLSTRGTRFAVGYVERMVRSRAREAGLAGRVTPHALRHTAAVHLLRGGADIRFIQEFLGHASVGTTARYTRLDLADLREALDAAHPRSRMGLAEHG